ncbi:hypothetical protein E3J38_06530 [candidate division TA06 bacterium]|uniref:YprB ribonuclease H-like domain-containing protein n=1 Tax=candidate division TA06 bacterium TaxID=2250710 RepID=A0A523XLY7_UNCT6|nr:MAG: hypothetical protein E3J38_06530 [candidate division TA06 bacterium]
MADVFIDCEWVSGEYLTILGAYSFGQRKLQLYDKTLTAGRFTRFLARCCARAPGVFLFAHGPDIGRIERYFGLDLKKQYCCVNTQTAFRKFTNFRNVSLDHLEKHFGLPRRHILSATDIDVLWTSGNRTDRRQVLEYNHEDCMNLWRLIRILKREHGITKAELKSIAM